MPRLLDHWKNLERTNHRLWLGFWGMVVVALVEGWSLGRPTPIHVIPGAAVPGISYPNTGWETVVRDFAEYYVLTLGNFTPQTARKSYEAALRYLAPEALSRAQSGLAAELERIQRDRISSQFAPDGQVTVRNVDGVVVAEVRGNKKVYAGRELLTEKTVTYRLSLTRVHPTEANPQGLQIVGVAQEDEQTSSVKKGGAA